MAANGRLQARGLSAGQWVFCLAVAAFSIPWQQAINWVADKTLHLEESRGVGGGIMKFGEGKISHGSRSGSFRGLSHVSQTSFDTRREEARVLERSVSQRGPTLKAVV